MKTKRISIHISEEHRNQRIDKVLSLYPEVNSRSQAHKLIESGAVLVGGHKVKPSYLVQTEDLISLEIPIKDNPENLTPYPLKLHILHEDSDILVVNKGAPLVVHPSPGHSEKTLVHALLHYTSQLAEGFSPDRPGVVHRLDKDTSGVLVIAKNNRARDFLAEQFKNRSVSRKYLALCYGHLKNKKGRIESFIGRHPVHRKKIATLKESGKQAITHYQVLQESHKGVSLLEVSLETGRTHQIRVHLSELGHPVLGDSLYGSDSRCKNLKSKKDQILVSSLGRIALHAHSLGFIHPTTKEKIFFESPLPTEIQFLIQALLEA